MKQYIIIGVAILVILSLNFWQSSYLEDTSRYLLADINEIDNCGYLIGDGTSHISSLSNYFVFSRFSPTLNITLCTAVYKFILTSFCNISS